MRRQVFQGITMGALGLWAAQAGVAQAQEAGWVDPCAQYQAYVDDGAGESLMAQSYRSVCEKVGSVPISPDCITYYSFLSSFGEENTLTRSRATACDSSMPGFRAQLAQSGAGGGQPAPGASASTAAPGAPVAADTPAADGDTGDAAMQAELTFWNSVRDSDDPAAFEAYLSQYPDGTFAPLARLRLSQLAQAAMPEVQPEADTAGAKDGAKNGADAAELLFWDSIKDSTDPAVFEAYLTQYSDGAFAQLAVIKLDALQNRSVAPVPVQVQPVEEDPASDPSARQLVQQAEAIMKAVRGEPRPKRAAAAREALPLYRQAADMGSAKAKVAIGTFLERGLGVQKNHDRALARYRAAARQGYMPGYEKALKLLDKTDKHAQLVELFVEYYRKRPKKALELLDTLSNEAIVAVQGRLKREGYYFGALDADFGPQSVKALKGFASGAPKPSPPQRPVVVKRAPNTVLASRIQRQLRRVGCYYGAIDGVWGAGSVRAVQRFNFFAGSSLRASRPTQHALKRISGARRKICP